MCLVRLKAEGKDGRYMYRKLVEMMWHDVEERMKNLGVWMKCSQGQQALYVWLCL